MFKILLKKITVLSRDNCSSLLFYIYLINIIIKSTSYSAFKFTLIILSFFDVTVSFFQNYKNNTTLQIDGNVYSAKSETYLYNWFQEITLVSNYKSYIPLLIPQNNKKQAC